MYSELYAFIEKFKESVKYREEKCCMLHLDTSLFSSGDYMKVSRDALYASLIKEVERKRAEIKAEKPISDSFYELVTEYIKRLDNERYFKKNGEVKTTLFCEDAFVGSDSWAALINGKGCEKETALRLVMALRLDEGNADRLLGSMGWFLNVRDERDVVLMALMALGEYRPIVIYNVLEHEREKNKNIRNIYTKKHYELMCE
ncbi:MAG: hypothetical protein IKU60_03455 [Clostridia bacterium]|nr:hypothetical protein [Clostridia bacterium]